MPHESYLLERMCYEVHALEASPETGMELELAGLDRSEAVDGCLGRLILIKMWGVVHGKHFSTGFWREPRH
jgi:hypothetical protein